MTTVESIGLSEATKTTNIINPEQFTERVKLINDHNLRILIEQNVELRHCDTLSVTSLAVSAALVGAIATIAYNITLKSDQNAVSFKWVFFDWVFFPSLFIGFFLVMTGFYIMATGKKAEENIGTFYKNFTELNGIPLENLISIRQKQTPKKNQVELKYGKTSLAPFVILAGAVFLVLLLIFSLVEISTGHGN